MRTVEPKAVITLRISDELHQRIKDAAETEGVSINKWLTQVVQEELANATNKS